ncbi:MAG: glycosyltransferase family 4 protein, partial [Desulfobacteraceae bacterium]|nr:glycosyltransferase family 4 protein [Desulfobacteraceae bacterium]
MNLRICYILPRLFLGESGIVVGAAAANCVSLAFELRQQGVQIELLAPVPEKCLKYLADHPVGEIVRPLPNTGTGLIGKGISAIWSLHRLLKVRIKEKNYNIVHCHSGSYMYAIIPLAANQDSIVRLHSPYCPLGTSGGLYGGWWEKPFAARFLFSRLDKVIVVTSNVRQSTEKAGILPEKIELIPMSVDSRRFHPIMDHRSSVYFPEESKGARILFVGNASKEKGLIELLKAVWLLLQNGFSPYLVATVENASGVEEYARRYDYIKRLVDELGLAHNVRILGLVDCIENLYAESDLVVFPWTTTRGPCDHPMVALEAMAMAKCIVSTPVGGCPELLMYGKAGILTKGFSSESLAAALEYAINHPEILKQKGQAALEAANNFSVEKNGKR